MLGPTRFGKLPTHSLVTRDRALVQLGAGERARSIKQGSRRILRILAGGALEELGRLRVIAARRVQRKAAQVGEAPDWRRRAGRLRDQRQLRLGGFDPTGLRQSRRAIEVLGFRKTIRTAGALERRKRGIALGAQRCGQREPTIVGVRRALVAHLRSQRGPQGTRANLCTAGVFRLTQARQRAVEGQPRLGQLDALDVSRRSRQQTFGVWVPLVVLRGLREGPHAQLGARAQARDLRRQLRQRRFETSEQRQRRGRVVELDDDPRVNEAQLGLRALGLR